ncbi:MAG: hypothetical protein HY314_08570 [Acidobacteria bacterium]|nr:hypothetical protein [Acidobacteriota bacterium]
MDSRYERTQLTTFIRAARWRWRGAVALKGLAVSLAIGGVAFTSSAALADHFHYARAWVIALRVVSMLIFVAAVGFFLLRPLLKRIPDIRMAQLIEEKNPGLHNRLVTAIEFADQAAQANAPLINRLVRDAAQRAMSLNLDTVAPRNRLQLYGGVLVALLITFAWLLIGGPDFLSTGFSRLYAPWSDAASASPYAIIVEPGNARVPKGSDQTVMAKLQGFDAERVEIYLKQPSQPSWIIQPMELNHESREHRFLFFNLQENIFYYVQASHIRSPEFTIEVADLARVERISLTYQLPAYTGMPVKTVEDGGDIVALKGTTVKVLSILNRPAEAATIVMEDGATAKMEPAGPNQFVGQIVVRNKGTYRIDLTSGGETYTGSGVYEIVALDDEPPVVTIEKPGRDMKATSIQEVFTQAKAEDDNGIAALELHFSINGGKEQTVSLYRASRNAPKQITGAHTFFLEEYNLQPGDFISYYATVKDGNTASGPGQGASDIYFLEIRPFDRTYRQAQQNPGMEGGGNDSALTQRQKEIIAATWRVIREQPTQPPPEFSDNLNAIALIQDRLRQDAESLANRIRQRFGASLDEQEEFKQLAQYLEQAAKEMEAALKELKAQKPKEALPPEQRALQQLMRADAIFREIQVAFGSNGQGEGDNARAEDLANLFELELDKMKNQYETLQRDRGQQQNRQVDETLRKLQELARRQQKEAEEQLRRAMQGAPRNQSGGGGSQQQQLMEEAQQLARQLERLSRERRDERLAETSRQLKRALEEMQRAQWSGSSAEAAARSQRAAEQLEAAKRRLQSNQQARGQEGIRRLRERATQATERQREIAEEVEELARAGQSGNRPSSEAIKRRVEQRKDVLAGEVEGLRQDIEAAARGAGQDQSAANKLKDAANTIQRNRLPDKIRQGNRLLENEWYDQARQREREIQEDLNQVVRSLQAAEGSTARSGDQEKLEEALNRTRQLADDLESLQRRLQEQSQGRSQPDQGQSSQNRQNQNQQDRANSQSHQSQRQQGQQNAQQGNPRNPANNDQTARLPNQGEEFPFQGGRPRRGGDPRQLEREFAERMRDAEALRRQLGSEFAEDLDKLIRRLRQLDDKLFNDPEEIARLKSQLIDPLRQLEHELARRLQAALGPTGPRLVDETSVPEAYRKLVEEYYKRLAGKK